MYVTQYFFVLGLGHTNPNTAAIFQPLSPAVVVVLAFVFGVERLTWRKVLGFAIGVGAAVCVALPSHTHTHVPGWRLRGACRTRADLCCIRQPQDCLRRRDPPPSSLLP